MKRFCLFAAGVLTAIAVAGQRISKRRITIPVALMGLTALMVVAVPSAASAETITSLENIGSGMCMTNGGSTANSAPITQYTCNGSANQRFNWTGSTIVDEAGMCLTDGGSTANSYPITQYPCNGSPNQTWYTGENSSIYFTIYNPKNFCMTTGGSKKNSTPITQYMCNGSNNQLWEELE
jgi:hypothetical protein